MANYRAVANGNWSSGATWGGGAVPPNGEGHNIYSNNFTVTVDQNVDVALITNASITASFVGGGTSATAGGTFALNNGVQVVGNIARNNTNQAAGLVTTSGTVSATITGNVTTNSTGSSANNVAIDHASTGTLTITGNLIGGSHISLGTWALRNTSTGTVNIYGNVTGGSGGNSTNTFSYAISNSTSGIVNITGNVTGGSGASGNSAINGSGQINIVGNCTGGSSTNSFAVSANGSLLTVQGNITATNSVGAISSTATSNLFSGSIYFSAEGNNPITCAKFRLSPLPTNAVTRYALNGTSTYVDMYTADNNLGQASISDVRLGTVYANGALTGTLIVPAANSVAFGVPVDNTTGTAVLTPSAVADAVWDALLADHTSNNTFGARVVRSLNSNNTLQLTGSHHAAADVHEFQSQVITDDAFAPSAITALAIPEVQEMHLIHGLKSGSAMTVTPTSRVAGAVSQTISGDGSTSTTVTRD
jgi:hypothetical protein